MRAHVWFQHWRQLYFLVVKVVALFSRLLPIMRLPQLLLQSELVHLWFILLLEGLLSTS